MRCSPIKKDKQHARARNQRLQCLTERDVDAFEFKKQIWEDSGPRTKAVSTQA